MMMWCFMPLWSWFASWQSAVHVLKVKRIRAQAQEAGRRPGCSPAATTTALTTLCPDGPARVCSSSVGHTGRSECRTPGPSPAERDTLPPSPSESRRCLLWAAGWAAGLLLPSAAAPARLSEACGKSRAGRRSSRQREEEAGEWK